jgi:hypothetical protein
MNQPTKLLPIGHRIKHFNGGSGTHGLGKIVGYNGQMGNIYADEKFKDAAEISVAAGLGTAFVNSLYDGIRYPYIIQFDNGYKDVYGLDSIRSFDGDEIFFAEEGLLPSQQHSLIDMIVNHTSNYTREELMDDWIVAGGIAVTGLTVKHPTRGVYFIDSSDRRNFNIQFSTNAVLTHRQIETTTLKDVDGRLLYALPESFFTGRHIGFHFDTILMVLEEKPLQEQKFSLFGKSINDYNQIDEGFELVSFNIKASLIHKPI